MMSETLLINWWASFSEPKYVFPFVMRRTIFSASLHPLWPCSRELLMRERLLMKADSKSALPSSNWISKIAFSISWMLALTGIRESESERTSTRSEKVRTPTLSPTLRVWTIRIAALWLLSWIVGVDWVRSIRITTFFAPAAAILYQGLVLGS